MLLMRFSTRRLRSPRAGSTTSLKRFPTPTPKSLRSGTTRKMVTGLLPLSVTPSARRLLGAVNGSGALILVSIQLLVLTVIP